MCGHARKKNWVHISTSSYRTTTLNFVFHFPEETRASDRHKSTDIGLLRFDDIQLCPTLAQNRQTWAVLRRLEHGLRAWHLIYLGNAIQMRLRARTLCSSLLKSDQLFSVVEKVEPNFDKKSIGAHLKNRDCSIGVGSTRIRLTLREIL